MNPGRQTVPKPWSSGCKAPVAEPCWSVGHNTCRCRPIIAGVRDELTVIDKMHHEVPCRPGGQLKVHSLSDWKPVELPQHWSKVVMSTKHVKHDGALVHPRAACVWSLPSLSLCSIHWPNDICITRHRWHQVRASDGAAVTQVAVAQRLLYLVTVSSYFLK